MRMLDHLNARKDEVGSIGRRERDGARADGVSSFWTDHPIDGVIEEKPDGAKEVHSHPFSAKPGLHAAE